MKKLFLLLASLAAINLAAVSNVNAQRNGHNNDRSKNHNANARSKHYNKGNNKNKHDNRRDYPYAKNNNKVRHAGSTYHQKPPIHNRRDKYVTRNNYRRHNNMPGWANAHRYNARHHVYFRDYNAFYDPNRGGYIYWYNNAWIFSPTVPLFMAGVNLNRARIQVINDVPFDARPEIYYDRYARRYPRNVNIQINIPLPPHARR